MATSGSVLTMTTDTVVPATAESAEDIAFLTLHRKNGTVGVVSTDTGWFITGRGTGSTMYMKIPRCSCFKHVCLTLHKMWGGTTTINDHGNNDGHGHNHCHRGHVERVRKVIDLIARTYGPAVK